LRQRKVVGLAYHSQHGKLWQGIKAALDWTRAKASNFADAAEWAFGRRTARVLGVVVLFAVVVALLLVFLDWYIAPTKPGDKKDLVLAMAQILAGTALLSGLYFTWRTLQVNREGQITERFTRAIEQLGATHADNSKNLVLRLGGVYALERISKESKEDHWSIIEVLTAYVRQHTPWRPEEAQQDAAVQKKSEYSTGKSEPSEVPGLAADIQAIMTVIRRRTRSFGNGEPEFLDLHETNLSGADFWYADLTGANLFKANLTGADLSHADLTTASFVKANLTDADLEYADLKYASLWNADLTGADLTGANLTDAQPTGANLTGANLWYANLSGAKHLTQGQLEKTTGDENTQLPPDLKPPAHWGVKTDEQTEGD
jgi:hypothetical protein